MILSDKKKNRPNQSPNKFTPNKAHEMMNKLPRIILLGNKTSKPKISQGPKLKGSKVLGSNLKTNHLG